MLTYLTKVRVVVNFTRLPSVITRYFDLCEDGQQLPIGEWVGHASLGKSYIEI